MKSRIFNCINRIEDFVCCVTALSPKYSLSRRNSTVWQEIFTGKCLSSCQSVGTMVHIAAYVSGEHYVTILYNEIHTCMFSSKKKMHPFTHIGSPCYGYKNIHLNLKFCEYQCDIVHFNVMQGDVENRNPRLQNEKFKLVFYGCSVLRFLRYTTYCFQF